MSAGTPRLAGEERPVPYSAVVMIFCSLVGHGAVLAAGVWRGVAQPPVALPLNLEVVLQWEKAEVSGLKGAEKNHEISVPRRVLPQLPRHQKIAQSAGGGKAVALPAVEGAVVPEAQHKKAAAVGQAGEAQAAARLALKKQEALRRLLKEKARKEQRHSDKVASPQVEKTQIKQKQAGEAPALSEQEVEERSQRIALFSQEVQLSIARYYSLPDVYRYANQDLKSSVAVVLDHSGAILRMKLERSSGDVRFDALSMRVIRRAAPLPHPPKEMVGREMVLHFTPFE